MPLHNAAWQEYLRRHGIRASIPEIEARMHGKHNDAIVRLFFGEGLTAEQITSHGARKEALFREMMRSRLRECLVPGVSAFVEQHRAARLGVASNAEPANVSFVLDGSGLRRHFDAVVDGGQVRSPKPDPEIYFETARRLDSPPAKCVVFEDSPVGVRAARQAGMKVVGLTTTSSSLEDCDLMVRDFLDPKLMPWLEQTGNTPAR